MTNRIKWQLSNFKEIRIGFIGAGRLGQALSWSLNNAGMNVIAVSSVIQEHALTLARPIKGCETMDAQALVDACDLIFLTTPDSVIGETCDQLIWHEGQAVVHCSGATEVDVLCNAKECGALIGGFHPMQTFGDPVAAVKTLPGCTVTVEAENSDLMQTLQTIVENLNCVCNQLPAGMRGRYHAAAGYTSQFINALFEQATNLWKTWGATEEQALKALLPLAHGTLSSIQNAGIARGMPGPVSRGDVISIEKHINAIKPMGTEMIHFYTTLCNRTIELARSAGAIDEIKANQFIELLQKEHP